MVTCRVAGLPWPRGAHLLADLLERRARDEAESTPARDAGAPDAAVVVVEGGEPQRRAGRGARDPQQLGVVELGVVGLGVLAEPGQRAGELARCRRAARSRCAPPGAGRPRCRAGAVRRPARRRAASASSAVPMPARAPRPAPFCSGARDRGAAHDHPADRGQAEGDALGEQRGGLEGAEHDGQGEGDQRRQHHGIPGWRARRATV